MTKIILQGCSPFWAKDAHIAVHEHADIEVGVSQPVCSLLEVGDCAEDNLCIEIVGNCGHVLALNGQLHVEEREVEAELSMPCKKATDLMASSLLPES